MCYDDVVIKVKRHNAYFCDFKKYITEKNLCAKI